MTLRPNVCHCFCSVVKIKHFFLRYSKCSQEHVEVTANLDPNDTTSSSHVTGMYTKPASTMLKGKRAYRKNGYK